LFPALPPQFPAELAIRADNEEVHLFVL